ncbi:hypothetical protein C5Y96_08110 [Blastopirellula marina]|uniref:Uncharacterized protein n=1 Tax=Blastopirellula marina TaxID=124 RepID=A0A2S8FY64_9BACT|nr:MULTISPECIES: hypothetical protein [Pirellulaceae]PQO37112.1 hypothetical protein C5Y96_08110 [Blastopirellula marina]RCS53827.1 hypothetical protein DTL36_08120 [Bremerella cremea]
MNDSVPPAKKASTGFRALRNVVGIIILLLVLVPRPTIGLPLAAIAAFVGVIYLAQRSFRWGRVFGGIVCAVLLLVVVGFTVVAVSAYQSHQQLLAKLAEHRHASVGVALWPYPFVDRLSVSGSVRDDDLRSMIEMPELQLLQKLHLESDNLTDACLKDVGGIRDLQLLFIDVRAITDEAILDFERDHPDCRVIAYGRNLHAQ